MRPRLRNGRTIVVGAVASARSVALVWREPALLDRVHLHRFGVSNLEAWADFDDLLGVDEEG